MIPVGTLSAIQQMQHERLRTHCWLTTRVSLNAHWHFGTLTGTMHWAGPHHALVGQNVKSLLAKSLQKMPVKQLFSVLKVIVICNLHQTSQVASQPKVQYSIIHLAETGKIMNIFNDHVTITL